MNFNFVFISYSVIYAKYSYCYEVPKEQPQRYFDGKEWKIVKPRPNIRPKVPRHSSISVDLDWAEPFKEMKAIEFEETTTQMPTCDIKTITDTIKEVTIKKANTDTSTIRKTTKKKFTTKATSAPKIFMRSLSHITLPTTTAKTILTHCRPVCKLKLKSATITTIDPRLLHLKMSRDWRDNWNFLRPTKKPSPVTSKQYTPLEAKNCYIPTIKNVHVTTTRKIATKGPVTVTKKPVTPYIRPVTTAWNPVKLIKRPVITTSKPVTSIRTTVITSKTPLIKTANYVKLSGKQKDVASPTGNWPNLLKEFLKYVDEKKCESPPCEYETVTSTMPFPRYERSDHRKTMQEDDDLMNILMDGVEIDDRLNEEDDKVSKSKETLEYEGPRINYESVEGSVSLMNNDYHVLGLKSLKDSITKRRDTGPFPKKMEYLKRVQEKNSKNKFTTSHNRESETYLDEFKDKNKNDDEVFEDYEAKSYPGSLETNHAKKRYLNSQIRASEEINFLQDDSKYAKKDDEMFQDIETKANSDTIKDKNDYMFSEIKRSKIHFDDSKDSKAQRDDKVLQASEPYSDTLKDRYIKKDYRNSRIRVSEVFSDELIDKNTRGVNEVIEDNVLNYFTNILQNKHAKKENEAESSDSYLDGENIRQQNKENYLQDKSTETFNSKELNEIKDYATPNLIYPTELTSQTNNEDLLQDSDITFDLEDDSIKADNDPKNRIGAQKRDSEYAYTFNDLNELK